MLGSRDDETRLPFWVPTLLIAGLLLSGAGLLPQSVIESLAARTGHSDDLSAERMTRWRVGVTGYGVCCCAIGVVLFAVGRRWARQVTRELSGSLRRVRWAQLRGESWRALIEPGWPFVVLIAAVGCGLRGRYLATPIDYDEAYSYLNYARRPLYQALADYNSTNNHLLNTLCMHVQSRLFGQREWALRLHVFAVGIAVLPATYALARSLAGPRAGLLAMSLVAVSPVLVNYSVNARAYELLALATLVMVQAFVARSRGRAAGIGTDQPDSPSVPTALGWCVAGAAAVAGLFAAPIMVYAVAGVAVWWLVEAKEPRMSWHERCRVVLAWLAATGMVTGMLYLPAFVFRGLDAFRHPFVQPLDWSDWLRQFPAALAEGLSVWIVSAPLDGSVAHVEPGSFVWPSIAAICGAGGVLVAVAALWARRATRTVAGTLAAIPAFMVLAMVGQRLAAPPRVFVFLVPLIVVLLAIFLDRVATAGASESSARLRVAMLSVAIGIAGSVWMLRDVLPYRSDEQSWRLSVREAVQAVADMVKSGEGSRASSAVLVALPADLPFHFYAAQSRVDLPIGVSFVSDARTNRVVLVLPVGVDPSRGLRENLSLRSAPESLTDRRWERHAAIGALAIWVTSSEW